MRLKTISALLAIVLLLSMFSVAFAPDGAVADSQAVSGKAQSEPAGEQPDTQTEEPVQAESEQTSPEQTEPEQTEPEQEEPEQEEPEQPEDSGQAEPSTPAPEEQPGGGEGQTLEIVDTDEMEPVVEAQAKAEDAELDGLAGLNATRLSHDSIRLSWNIIPGAEQYNIYRSETEDGEYALIKNQGSVTAYTDTGLKTGVTYYYKVEPANSAKAGAIAGPVSAKTTLNPITDFKVESYTCNRVRLNWETVEGANKYVIYRSTKPDEGFKALKLVGASAVAHSDTTVEAGTTYYYKIAPYCDSFRGDMAGAISARATFPKFESVTAESLNFETIKISWSALDGATKFLIYRSDSADGAFKSVGSVIKATEFIDTGLTKGQTYYYKVVPYRSSYRGAGSNVASVAAANPNNIQAFIDAAYAQLGKRYVLGGKGPSVFDCSGLIFYALNQSGNNIGYMTSGAWAKADFTTIYDFDAIQPGDVLCFPGHVALYVGNNLIVDASSSKGMVVERTSLNWRSNFICAKRPLG